MIFGLEDDKLSLVIVQFQFVNEHPCSNFLDAFFQFFQCMFAVSKDRWIKRDIKLGVICIYVIFDAMSLTNSSNGNGISCEQHRTQNRPLWYSPWQRSWLWYCHTNPNPLISLIQVVPEPAQCHTFHANMLFQGIYHSIRIDGIKCSTEI